MRINVNSDHYVIGKNRHKPCEDYGISGTEPIPFAILADGCSSSPGSHVGAMLLTLAARRQIREIYHDDQPGQKLDYAAFGRSVITKASLLARYMDLPASILDATLMTAVYVNRQIIVYVYGDGFIIALPKENKESRIIEIEFETNAPYYLSYLLNEERNRQYHMEKGGSKHIRRNYDTSLILKNNEPVIYKFSADEFQTVVLASDGLGFFADTANPERGLLPAEDVIREFTAFKNFNGEFIKRRARRAIKTYQKIGMINMDDVSTAGIHMEE